MPRVIAQSSLCRSHNNLPIFQSTNLSMRGFTSDRLRAFPPFPPTIPQATSCSDFTASSGLREESPGRIVVGLFARVEAAAIDGDRASVWPGRRARAPVQRSASSGCARRTQLRRRSRTRGLRRRDRRSAAAPAEVAGRCRDGGDVFGAAVFSARCHRRRSGSAALQRRPPGRDPSPRAAAARGSRAVR